MNADDRDTTPPPPPSARPSLDEVLTEQTSRYVQLVGQIIDPVRTTLQHLVDDLLKLRHEVRARLDTHDQLLERHDRRLDAHELRFDDLEQRLRALEQKGR